MKSPKSQILKIVYRKFKKKYPEMGPCGSVWAHDKTGRSHMAQDHFETLSDPKRIHERSQNDPKPV